MKSILDYIAEETNGKNYKSYKYCFENVEVPKLEYDDKQGIKVKRSGETDKSLKASRSMRQMTIVVSEESYIKPINNEIYIELYPNPVKNEIYIKINNPKIKQVEVSVININGQCVYNKKNINITNEIKITDFKAESGVYFVKIQTDNYISTNKFIKLN